MFSWLKHWWGGSKRGRSLEGYQWSDAHSSPPKERLKVVAPDPPVRVGVELVEGAWLRGGVPSSHDPNQVRTELLRALYEEKEGQAAPEDEAFVQRLIQVVGTQKLDFPPFPDIARDLDALLKERDPSMFQVVRLVEQDPALVRRVWVAGSGAAFMTAPSGLHHAIARIGFDALWRIGMAVCMHSQVFRVRGYQAVADEVRAHGILVGELAAWIRDEKRGHHYLAGLLHDVGKLVVYRAASVRDGLTAPNPKLVQMIVDRHHPALSMLAADAWNLGGRVTGAVGFHHHPISAPEEIRDLARVLWAADVAANTAKETRAGRECGGLAALEQLERLPKRSGAVIEKAHALLSTIEKQEAEEAAASSVQAG